MKLVILNGSPKGPESVSMQYILYIKKKHPEHQYKIIDVAQRIKSLEKNDIKFQETIEYIKNSDAVIWGFPVYVMLVCSQYKRFIELIFERNATNVFKEKYTAVLSTSIHFYDHTAQNYIHSICDDLNMRYVGFFAADSWDLFYPKRRARWLFFMEKFFEAIENKLPTTKQYQELKYRDFNYTPTEPISDKEKVDNKSKKVLVISEDTSNTTNLGKMVKRFQDSFKNNIEVINIYDLDIKGPCIGCTKCGYKHECIYKDKDGFTDFWINKVMKTDVLIFGGIIKDRFLSSRWKLIYDRAFFNNHTPTIVDKQYGYIISGPLSQIANLRELLQAHVEYQDSNFLGFITDEFGDSGEIDLLLHNFAKQAIDFSNANYIKPPTFLGEAAMKIFRDDVYGRNRFVFLADHEYYETHGIYDTFPHNDERAKKLNDKLIPLMKIDKIRSKMNLKQEFLRPFKKLLADPNK
ncbi:MAG: NAD(P)H-dependent oxidoreductase [Candidatus Heimdallarchaeota archaeon]